MNPQANLWSRRLVFSALFAAVALAIGLQAHQQWRYGDDAPRILQRVDTGPFRLLIGTIPDELDTRGGHLAVGVSDARTGRGVDDARVAITALGPNGRRMAPVTARTGGMDRQYYDAWLRLPEAGPWHLRVRVSSPAGSAATDLPVQVVAPEIPWGLLAAWLIPGAMLFALFFPRAHDERGGPPRPRAALPMRRAGS